MDKMIRPLCVQWWNKKFGYFLPDGFIGIFISFPVQFLTASIRVHP
jgi:hypothetical protein